MTNGAAWSAMPNRRRRISASIEPSAAPDPASQTLDATNVRTLRKAGPLFAMASRSLQSVVVGVRRGGHVDRLVVEVGHLDAVGAGQLEDLGGPGDARQVRPVANFAPVALELPEKLFRPSYFVL